MQVRFGGVELVDAADPGYFGFRGHDDKVLNYEGVGSMVPCRLNVRGLFQTSPDASPHVHFPFQLNRKAIRKLKARTTGC